MLNAEVASCAAYRSSERSVRTLWRDAVCRTVQWVHRLRDAVLRDRRCGRTFALHSFSHRRLWDRSAKGLGPVPRASNSRLPKKLTTRSGTCPSCASHRAWSRRPRSRKHCGCSSPWSTRFRRKGCRKVHHRNLVDPQVQSGKLSELPDGLRCNTTGDVEEHPFPPKLP